MAAGHDARDRLGGVDLPEGAKLFLWLAAAGRDAATFPEPDRFDLRRENASRHLAFGKGIHYCVGASLGKLEAQLALEGLSAPLPAAAARPRPGDPVSPEHLLPRALVALGRPARLITSTSVRGGAKRRPGRDPGVC